MVPMTDTPEQAEEIVRWSKFTPLGERGFGSGCALTDYVRRGGGHEEIMEAGIRRTISIAQIETRLAVDNADQIAGVNGIDVLLIGPYDLSISLGIPGDLMNPVELEVITHVAASWRKHRKFLGLHAEVGLLEKFSD
jgi:2-keto-3-deoxy-L-rhamnonate aldolase RhmA